MLTRRGFWLAGCALAILAPSVMFGAENAVLLAASVLLWFAYQWARFAVEARFLLGGLRLQRTVGGRACDRASLIVERPADVLVRLISPLDYELGLLKVQDRIPANLYAEGEIGKIASCRASEPIQLEYTVQALAPGIVRFEGLRIELLGRHGFFRCRRFLRDPQEIPVLPPVALEADATPQVKRRNVIPTQGIHRHKRPGSGTELLDLRDYIPGDPPKCIAWKVSARRDRLITKEYESEVPVRCTLFFDASDSMKVGPAEHAPAVQASRIAASLVNQLIAHRDPVGLCIFDANGSQVLAPAANARQLTRLRRWLAEAVAKPTSVQPCSPREPFDAAYRFADDVYPELMEASGRWRGAWWKWRAPTGYRWPIYSTVALGVAGLALVGVIAPPNRFWQVGVPAVLFFGIGLFGVLMLSQKLAGRGANLVSPSYLRRKRLATVLAALEGGDAGDAAMLLADDQLLAEKCQQFCNRSRVPVRLPLYSPAGDYLWKQPEKLDVLTRRLLNAASRGKDNELFVLCVDLLEIVDEAKRLFAAIKVVKARRHQVIVLCPWPAGMPFPDSPEWLRETDRTLDPDHSRFRDPQTTLYVHEFARFRAAYEHLKEQLKRAHVPLICTTPEDSVRQVLDRVERLRSGRAAVTGGTHPRPR